LEEDDDFDPRAAENDNLEVQPARDLLAGSSTDLSRVCPSPLAPTVQIDSDPEDFDPFDTSAVSAIVQPKATELKFIERELITESALKRSLSDPDFDPRADEEESDIPISVNIQTTHSEVPDNFDIARRKSSLSLNITSKTVGFVVPDQDLLGAGNEHPGNKKPLTPYYAPSGGAIAEKESEDPFDTSFVPEVKPSEIELKHLEEDLLKKPSLQADPDFDPRAPPTPIPAEDLLAVKENISAKVLTPAQESKDLPEEVEKVVDPFDTSIAADLRPGKAELKLLESELLPQSTQDTPTDVLDIQSDAQELGLGDKVLTPSIALKEISTPEDIDPFDTSIAANLAPGATEIKLLENELISN